MYNPPSWSFPYDQGNRVSTRIESATSVRIPNMHFGGALPHHALPRGGSTHRGIQEENVG